MTPSDVFTVEPVLWSDTGEVAHYRVVRNSDGRVMADGIATDQDAQGRVFDLAKDRP